MHLTINMYMYMYVSEGDHSNNIQYMHMYVSEGTVIHVLTVSSSSLMTMLKLLQAITKMIAVTSAQRKKQLLLIWCTDTTVYMYLYTELAQLVT